MIINFSWVLVSALEFYYASLTYEIFHHFTISWSYLPEYLYWYSFLYPYTVVEEVSLLLLKVVDSSIWALDSIYFLYSETLLLSLFLLFCPLYPFRLFSSTCKHVLGYPILKDMPPQTSSPPNLFPSYSPHFSALLWRQTSQSKIV